MSSFSAIPKAFIEIWPYSGGQFNITGGQGGILSLDVDKNIKNDSPGSFSLNLAPGGPYGVLGPSWQQIIEPYSMVLIGMQRFSHQNIVMIGLVTQVTESQTWTYRGVVRTVSVQGADFTLPYVTNNFYLQTYLSLTPLSALGSNAFLSSLGDGIIAGAPDIVGAAWFDKILAGTEGILAGLSYSYQTDRITFPELMASIFEPYPANMNIPYGDYFMSANGSWLSKYHEIFPFPWYEVFVNTAPIDYYGDMHTSGYPFTMDALPGAEPVTPTLVARTNPVPFTPNDNGGNIPMSMDFSEWDTLEVFQLENTGFIQSTVTSTEGDVRNYYVITPLNSTQAYGTNNALITPFTLKHAAFIDIASIHRYGFRSQISETHWMMDLTGQIAQQNAQSGNGDSAMDQLMAALQLRQTSYFEPIPLMRQAQVTMELRPDIIAGNGFQYAPYRTGELWDWYIDGVHHSFAFGGGATTTLTLSRGLPDAVYSDQGLMLNLSIGNAHVVDGIYTAGLPNGVTDKPLQPVNSDSITSGLLSQMAAIFGTPQGGNQ